MFNSRLSDSTFKLGEGLNLSFGALRRGEMCEGTRSYLFGEKKDKLKVQLFAGLALGGGKTDKTCLAVIEYYPQYRKIFLSELFPRIKTEGELSADQIVCQLLEELGKIEIIGFDTPLKLPKCMRCRLKCPGYENCSEPEIQWMWRHYRERNKKKRPKKLFTPYTERCSELFISSELEEPFHPPHAMGSNIAPLTARALFLKKRIKASAIEVYPKLSLWRIGRALGVAKSHLRFHKHSVDGGESRQAILERLIKKDIAFVYHQDAQTMIEFAPAFEAFICAMTAVLKHVGQTEKRPKDFPCLEPWIEFPCKTIYW